MKPPTTGERIVWGDLSHDDGRVHMLRQSGYFVIAKERELAAAIDAAIAAKDAERDAAIAAEREACAKRLDAMHAKFRRFAGDRDNWCDEKRDAYAEAALEASTEAAAIRARWNQ